MKQLIMHTSDDMYKHKYAQLLCYSLASALLLLFLSKQTNIYAYRDFLVFRACGLDVLYKHVEHFLIAVVISMFALPEGVKLDVS